MRNIVLIKGEKRELLMSNLVFILRNNRLFPMLTTEHVTQQYRANAEGKWHLLETLQHNIIVILLCSI